MINCGKHHAFLHNCVEKQKFVHWSGNAKLKLKFINVFATTSHPDKAYLGTPKVYFKNRCYKQISSFKNKTQIIKPPLQSMFGNTN